MAVDSVEEELDQQSILQLDGIEQIGSIKTLEQWTIWRGNLAISMCKVSFRFVRKMFFSQF